MSDRSRIGVGRVYDDPGPDDGQRVLVGRLWPRGFRKGDPRVDRWISKVTPSTELRAVVGAGPVTLVTAARDLEGSHVAVLARPTAVLGCLLLAT